MNKKFTIYLFALLIASGNIFSKELKINRYFTIKGKTINKSKDTWELSKSGFLDNETVTIKYNNNGSFCENIKIEGWQEINLYLNNDTITIYAGVGDSIHIFWDENDFTGTFQIISPDHVTNHFLQVNIKQHFKFKKEYNSLLNKQWQFSSIPDSLKFKRINDLYNNELKLLYSDTTFNAIKLDWFKYQLFFKYSELLVLCNLHSKYMLSNNKSIFDFKESDFKNKPIFRDIYKFQNSEWFYMCPGYRSFLITYIERNTGLFYGTVVNQKVRQLRDYEHSIQYYKTMYYEKRLDTIYREYGDDRYFMGLATLENILIRDWYLTNLIFKAFYNGPFTKAETMYKDFMSKCQTMVYKDTLTAFYRKISKIKPGSKAPGFDVIDIKGNEIQLIDFKGNTVLLGFFDENDRPYIYTLEELNKKYKDKNIDFLFFCVNEKKDDWVKSFDKLKLQNFHFFNINIANDKILTNYFINRFPRYLLIDKNGKIVNNFAPEPFEICYPQKNELDYLLDQKK